MLQGWVVVIIALAYIGFLFVVASYGDRRRELARGTASRLLIYPLSLAIYCTSWTFFGSVGLASRTGYDFLTIYIGPMLMVGLAWPLIVRVVRLAKGQNITSIADLIAARYGKSQAVAATVALIAIIGMVPYIALQLKAVSASVGTILAQAYPGGAQPLVGDSALLVALLMAAFAVLFGTRHTDATEHQDGLMLAVATESIVKLLAFLAVGVFVTFVMFHGPFALLSRALAQADTAAVLMRTPQIGSFCAMTTLSLFAIMLLPSVSDAGIVSAGILTEGPWALAYLRPQALFGLDLPPLVHGVLLSLAVNVAFYIGCSLSRRPTGIERMQADVFVPSSLAPILAPMTPGFRLRRAAVTVEELIATVARYLGEERTRESFTSFAASRRISLAPQAEADFELLQYGEYLLASAIGAASSRLVLSLLLRKRAVSTKDALKLLDDANAAIHYNREILQTALDHVRQGIAVFNKDLHLLCWNHQFGEIFDLPHGLTRVGIALDEILRHVVQHGADADKNLDAAVAERIAKYTSEVEPFLERSDRGLVIEVRANRMPNGGLVTTFTDITPSVKAAEALERANATLERRVRDRTKELTRLNSELERAKAEADDANVSKTRFVAAASHDILQPLNAARLYVTSLIERQQQNAEASEDSGLVQNIDASLEAVEEIFAALLDISRLDTGAMKPEMADFRIDELLQRLDVEFAPLAREKGLALSFMPCSRTVRSDRRLLRRLLQNFVSNAIKYTPSGRVLVGCRHRGGKLRIDVYDTGIGIPQGKRRAVFKEFHRLDQGARVARGVGLGLSIVERIARVLGCEVALQSAVGRGSRFSVEVPRAAAVATAPTAQPLRLNAGRLTGTVALCIDNERSLLDGMEKLLGGWGCRVLTAADLAEALAAIEGSGLEPDGLLVDYHLDGGNGVAAIAELRRRLGRHVPAILITADRSLHVREEAQAEAAYILNKPLKPASLRALITQWRVQRVAAE